MDLTSIWESVRDQNPMFLAASGSVALGVTLVVTAGFFQLKRIRTRARRVAPAEIPAPAAPVEELAVASVPVEQPLESPEMRVLLTRLMAAADQLEKFRAASAAHPRPDEDSPLKRSPCGVDYIFRAGTG